MDNLFIVFFVIIIFTMCMGFKNRKNKVKHYVVEGQTNMDQEITQNLANEAQLLSSQGLCYENTSDATLAQEQAQRGLNPGEEAVQPKWPRDEQTCTGITGFNLEFLNKEEKLNIFNTIQEQTGISLSDTVRENELTLENNDIVQYEENLYVYYGEPINLNDTSVDEIVLFPYKHNDNDNVEYCVNLEGDVSITDDTKEICDADDSKIFLTPTTTEDTYVSLTTSDNYNVNQCGTDRFTGSGIVCVNPNDIKINNCFSNDLSGQIFQIKPKNFWKTQYASGSNHTITDMCEGIRTDDIWVYNSALNTMMDSQRFAEIQQNVDSTIISNLDRVFTTEYATSSSQNRRTDEEYESMLERLETAAEEARNRNCNYEGTISDPPLDVEDLYLGNIVNVSDQNTAGLYICEGGDNRLSATTVIETCPTSNLVCDENVSETVGLRRYIHCPDNHFKFEGCVPGRCKLSVDFYTKYRPKAMANLPSQEIVVNNNDSEQNTVSIHDLQDWHRKEQDPVDSLKIECSSSHHGTPNITQCLTGETIQISGCEINECNGADIPITESSKYGNLVTDQGTLAQWQSNNVNLECSRNNHQINNLNQFTQYISNLENDENYHGIDFACDSNGEGSGPFPISITNGCQPNICKNPKTNNIYDTSQDKPRMYSETLNIVNTVDDKYNKYVIDEYTGNISDNSNIIPGDLLGKIKCGKNYTLNGQNSGAGDSRELTVDNITCNSIYDINAMTDETDKSMPYIRGSIPSDDDSVQLTDPQSVSEFIGGLDETERYLNFSFDGCEINKCQWPKYAPNDVNSINYDKPRVRIADPPEGYTDDAIDAGVISVLQDENSNRYLMGYYHNTTGDESDITQDKTSLQTAEEWAGYSGDESKLRCYSYEEGETSGCQVEETYRNYEIDNMINSSNNDNIAELVMKGQIDQSGLETLTNGNVKWGEYFQNVKRGGPFKVERCFTETSEPKVVCQGDNDAQNCTGDDSNCSAQLIGCEQNSCKLHKDDSDSGTRLLVERSTPNGIVHQTIGGLTNDNFAGDASPLITVDQIRNITCDEDYSKSNISDDNLNPEIVIRCPVEGGYFIIENKCQRTICDREGNINEIDGVIKLINHNTFDVSSPLRTCPTQSIYKSHIFNNSISSEDPPAQVSDLPTLTRENCKNINTNNPNDDTIIDINKARYTFNSSNNTFSCETNTSNNKITSISEDPDSNGIAIEKCNFIPGEDRPSRSLRGCQPKLCQIPSSLPDGVIINDQFNYPGLDITTPFSSDIFDVNYHSGSDAININSSDINNIQNIESETDGQPLFKCMDGYHRTSTGPIEFTCEQSSSDYSSGVANPFVVQESCEINRCSIPPSFLEGNHNIVHSYDTDTSPKTTEEFMTGINCGEGYYRNENIRLKCNQSQGEESGNFTIHLQNPNGEFTDIDEWNQYCIAFTCPATDITPTIENPRTITRDGDGTLDTYIREIVAPPNPHHCYIGLHDGLDHTNYSSITCNTEYCYGTANMQCPGHNEPLNVHGCEEKYCRIPNLYNRTNINYNFNTKDDNGLSLSEKLFALQAVQMEPHGGITKEQFERTTSAGNFSCSRFAQAQAGGPSVTCNENNNEFIFSGCTSYEHNDSKSYTTGTTGYSYYPCGCSITKDNAFIYLSGTDVFGDNLDNDSGESITHSLNRNELYTESDDRPFYYYKYSSESDTHIYKSSEGEDEEALLREEWNKVFMHIKYDALQPSQRQSNMKPFMDTSREWCDRIESCGGFNVSKVSALTAEINAIDKCTSAQTGDEKCRNQVTGEVDRDKLLTFLQGGNKFLEMGTFKSEHKNTDCYTYLACDRQTEFHRDWGDVTSSGGNSYVYVNVQSGSDGHDILNPDIVSENMSIFMRQLLPTTEGSTLEQRGYTQFDEEP
jgi:hypothetical protein